MQAVKKNSFASEMVDSFRVDDGKLPSLPNAVIYLEKAVSDETVSLSVLADLLSKDPVLAARLLRVSNSTFYRAMSPAENVPAAVTRIGLLATRNIALGLLRNSFKARNDVVAAMITELWMESLKTAAVANALAPYYALLDPQRALLGGLMYNVGAMLLLTKLDEKADTFERADVQQVVDEHAPEFGIRLLQHWEMDPEIIEVAATRDLWQRDHDGAPDLADLVLVARSCIPDVNGRRPDYAQCEALPSYGRINRYLRLTEPLESVVDAADEAIERTLDLFF
ncbi:MAG: HD-like signal output (HDOD) protein [Granulosicoccus sp.]|jgi:HD-like signal output (HDOD) protein